MLDSISRNATPGGDELPNSTTILVLGILSIISCLCYGLPGAILGIIALVLSRRAKALYEQAPEIWSQSSYNNMNAGRICAIIGLIGSALAILGIIAYFAFIFTMLDSAGFPQ